MVPRHPSLTGTVSHARVYDAGSTSAASIDLSICLDTGVLTTAVISGHCVGSAVFWDPRPAGRLGRARDRRFQRPSPIPIRLSRCGLLAQAALALLRAGLQPQAVPSPEATDQVPPRGSFKGERLLGALVDARGGTGQCIRLRRPPRTGRGGSPSQLWHGRGDAAGMDALAP